MQSKLKNKCLTTVLVGWQLSKEKTETSNTKMCMNFNNHSKGIQS